jgi:hypothetical protein
MSDAANHGVPGGHNASTNTRYLYSVALSESFLRELYIAICFTGKRERYYKMSNKNSFLFNVVQPLTILYL